MFDAPGSETHPITVVLFWSVFTMPLACLLAIVVAWSFYALGRPRMARWASALPVINLIVGVVAFVCLTIFQGGQF